MSDDEAPPTIAMPAVTAVPLCPVCAEVTAAPGDERCPKCQTPLALRGRYRLERLLGGGGQGHTFAAYDAQSGHRVAIKELSLAYVRDWKSVDLFRRQAQVMAAIDHPSIPKLHDYFEEERAGVTFFYLVQELIDGESFAQELARGRRYDEGEVVGIARAVLEVLRYLHALHPPIIHRDLKPSNLMRRHDGRLVLIDFGLVRDALKPDGGSTVAAGTPGYAPIEQFSGYATPATDLYALGATLVALLTRSEPSALMKAGELRLPFERHVRVSPALAVVLHKLLEPTPDERYQSAEEVLDALAPQRLAEGDDDDASGVSHADLRRAALSPRKKRRGLGFFSLTILLLVGGFVMTPSCPVVVGKLSGYHDVVMATLHKCPAALAALGDDASVSSFGCMGTGEASCGGGTGQASFSYPVGGSRGSGRYYFDAVKMRGREWSVASGHLEIDGKTLDVVACAGVTAGGFDPGAVQALARAAGGQGGAAAPAAAPAANASPARVVSGSAAREIQIAEPATAPAVVRKRAAAADDADADDESAGKTPEPVKPVDPAVAARRAEYARVLASLREAIANGEPDYDKKTDHAKMRALRPLLNQLRKLDSGEPTTREVELEYAELNRYHSGRGPIRHNRMPADEYRGADADTLKSRAAAAVRARHPRSQVVVVHATPAEWKQSYGQMSLELHVLVKNQRGRYWVHRVYGRRRLDRKSGGFTDPTVTYAAMYPMGLAPENVPAK